MGVYECFVDEDIVVADESNGSESESSLPPCSIGYGFNEHASLEEMSSVLEAMAIAQSLVDAGYIRVYENEYHEQVTPTDVVAATLLSRVRFAASEVNMYLRGYPRVYEYKHASNPLCWSFCRDAYPYYMGAVDVWRSFAGGDVFHPDVMEMTRVWMGVVSYLEERTLDYKAYLNAMDKCVQKERAALRAEKDATIHAWDTLWTAMSAVGLTVDMAGRFIEEDGNRGCKTRVLKACKDGIFGGFTSKQVNAVFDYLLAENVFAIDGKHVVHKGDCHADVFSADTICDVVGVRHEFEDDRAKRLWQVVSFLSISAGKGVVGKCVSSDDAEDVVFDDVLEMVLEADEKVDDFIVMDAVVEDEREFQHADA